MGQVRPGLAGFYDIHRGELLRFLIARTGDQGEAEDVLQEVWLRISQTAATPVENGRAYLYRVAQNLVVDRVRERQRRMRRERSWLAESGGIADAGSEPMDLGRNAEEAIFDREETAALASAITTIPEAARTAFRMHKLEGLSHAEVAERLAISKSGVEKHLAVAMKYLRRALLD